MHSTRFCSILYVFSILHFCTNIFIRSDVYMQLQSYVAVQTSGFVCKVRIENVLFIFISRNAYAFGRALQKKRIS